MKIYSNALNSSKWNRSHLGIFEDAGSKDKEKLMILGRAVDADARQELGPGIILNARVSNTQTYPIN
uniref:Uncharacterized protein n=1 Tax=Romanomermis culicivorax TaxID=13658 RepID=A0A915IVV6_ROMCU